MRLLKDSHPNDTIRRIRAILHELGIMVYEDGWSSAFKHCDSVSITNSGLRSMTVNGKGTSHEAALASAYAELLERLQNRGSTISLHRYGLMGENEFYFTDQEEIDFQKLLDEQKSVLECLVEDIDDGLPSPPAGKLLCVPFYDVAMDAVVNLPYEFVGRACGHNGLCAGNTPEEALVQGIGEVFERYAIRRVFETETPLPTIPHETFKKSEPYEILEEIQDRGYVVSIKDCTIGGRYPVLGVVLSNKDTGKFRVIFGSHPVAETALERCFTEIFQGKDEVDKYLDPLLPVPPAHREDDFLSGRDATAMERIKYVMQNKGRLFANDFFYRRSDETRSFRNAFEESFRSNLDSLRFLLGLINDNGHRMFIRDVSFLGFPSYRVYIPGISEVSRLHKEEIRFLNEQDVFFNCLFRLKKSSDHKIRRCAEMLENLYHIPLYHAANKCDRDVFAYFRAMVLEPESDYNKLLKLECLLSFLFLRVGEYEKALRYLDVYVEENRDDLENINYLCCARSFLYLKGRGYSDEEISDNLSDLHGEELAEEVTSDLSDPENVFQYLTLPECGDCSVCPVSSECKFDEWSQLNSKLLRKMEENPIDQRNLARLFIQS